MSLGSLIPLAAGIGACALAGAVIARAPSARVARLAAAGLAVTLAWAGLQFAWSHCSDPVTALRLMRLGGVALLLGPLALHLFIAVNPGYARELRGMLGVAYGATAALIAIQVATPWVMAGAVRVPWGWVYRPGPALVAAWAVGAGSVALAWLIVLRGRRLDAAPRSRRARLLGGLLIAIPMAVGTATDFALPALGRPAPLLGIVCIVTIAACSWLAARPLGYTLLSPRTFATEILETLPDGVALVRQDRCIRVANARLAHLLSLPRRDVIGCCIDEFLPAPLPDVPAVGEIQDHETVLRLPTGVVVPVALSTRALVDRQGEPIGQVLVLRDQREVVDLRARLVTSARMAAVGELAAGIAHEVNNPIAFIQSNLNLLAQHLEAIGECFAKEGAERPSEIDSGAVRTIRLQEEVERVAAIVREVRSFAHAGPSGRVAADVNELVESAARVAAPLLRGRVALERDYGVLPPVVCAPQQLKQLFLNLIVTAARSPDTPALRIRTVSDSEAALVWIDCPPGEGAVALARLFDPFAGDGPRSASGHLGLAICQQIVAAHDGDLRVLPTPDGGTRVRVRLPLPEAGEDPA